MKIILIGHRGVGKTSLARRMKKYFSTVPVIDLDEEISRSEKATVTEIFASRSELEFRELEQKHLFSIIRSQTEFILSVGAGCDLSVVRDQYRDVKILWIRRETDLQGRIFLDRPRLNSQVSALEEYLERAHVREEKYWRWSHQVYTMPEGLGQWPLSDSATQTEMKLLKAELGSIGGGLTVLPEAFRDESSKNFFAERFLHQQPDFFELRDDLLNPEQIHDFLKIFKKDNVIFSLRAQLEIPYWVQESQCWIDWALEMGPPSEQVFNLKDRLILSLHDVSSFDAGLVKLRNYETERAAKHFKFSPFVKTWEELAKGLEWQAQSPATRSFLPRSVNGRWLWVRLYLKGRQLINFWREGFGSALDQPSLWQWMSAVADKKGFAAVLGSPIRQSYSPLFHFDFFHQRRMDFYPIQIEVNEYEFAFKLLCKLGLQAAAVTSPLKDSVDSARSGQNTIIISSDKNKNFATDTEGLVALKAELPTDAEVIVWGGGGVLPALETVFPEAFYVSARTGNLRQSEEALPAKQKGHRVLIWAAPNSADIKWPQAYLKIDMILDLNYTAHSLGLAVAQTLQIPYVSGLAMFVAQAKAQQELWRTYLGS